MIQANPASLASYVSSLCAIPRASTDFEGQQKAAGFIAHVMESHGLDPHYQSFRVDGGQTQNVIASVGPIGKPRFVIGAHYDTCDHFPGADDNASGVAGLLEIARLLSPIHRDIPCHVDLVAYALEEPPYFGSDDMGSFRHARLLKENRAAVALMMSLEMIGCFSDLPGSQEFPMDLAQSLPATLQNKGNFLVVAARPEDEPLPQNVATIMRGRTALPIIPIGIEELSGMSDNASYWEHGYPAVMATDTSFLRNKNYHTKDDTPEKLDYERMAAVIDGVMGLILNFDDFVGVGGVGA
jgi:Zn-dependent M28 family amino/carboxypeptidase